VFLIVLSSLLAVAYVWRFVEVAYFRAPRSELIGVQEAPLALALPAWILVGATLWFGVDTSITVGSASRAAALLLGVAP